MCGNTVNEDVSLAFVHTTGAANNVSQEHYKGLAANIISVF